MKTEKELKEVLKEEMEEFKSMSKKELIEEIYRLRIVVLKGNVEAIKKTKAEVQQVIEWYYNDLQKAIDKTHETEKYEISDGEMAKIIMEKGQLLLKELLQKLGWEGK